MNSLYIKLFLALLFITEALGAVVPEISQNVKQGSIKSLEAVSQLENLRSNDSSTPLQKQTSKNNEIPISMKEIVRLVDQNNYLEKNPIKKNFHPTEKYKSSFSNNKSELESTPLDIAEYIFWTGDERGVAMALKDFLQDGWVAKEDAIYFLEQVENELKTLKQRYSSDEVPFPDEYSIGKENGESTQEKNPVINSSPFREKALEQILYEISKKLFTSAGSKSPEIVQQLVTYIETQGLDGKLDKDLEKSILDILVTAFVESVKENDISTSPLKKLEFSKSSLMAKTRNG